MSLRISGKALMSTLLIVKSKRHFAFSFISFFQFVASSPPSHRFLRRRNFKDEKGEGKIWKNQILL